jgi:hypothetical protein
MTPVASSSVREVATELMHLLRLSLVTRGCYCRAWREFGRVVSDCFLGIDAASGILPCFCFLLCNMPQGERRAETAGAKTSVLFTLGTHAKRGATLVRDTWRPHKLPRQCACERTPSNIYAHL